MGLLGLSVGITFSHTTSCSRSWRNNRTSCHHNASAKKIKTKNTQTLIWPTGGIKSFVDFCFSWGSEPPPPQNEGCVCSGLDMVGFNSWWGQEVFLFSKTYRLALMSTLFIGYQGFFSWRFKPTAQQLHQMLRLRMSGTIFLYPFCAFMACTRMILPLSEINIPRQYTTVVNYT
jgi:hypothetical protein